MAVTIYDIAREANVGIGTVSRVFNNSPNVTPQTRDKVILVAKKLNYQPHVYAQALAKKKSNTLSAIIPFFTNYFFIEVLRGMHDTLLQHGYDLLLQGVNSKEQVGNYLQKSLKKGRVDGILFFSMALPDEYAAQIKDQNIPTVLVDTFHPEFDSIVIKNCEGAKVATRHLIELGHTNIGMINANIGSTPALERLNGFRQMLQEQNITLLEENIIASTSTIQDGFNKDAGYSSMKELLQRTTKLPTAFFVSSDVQAIGVIEALKEHGLNVPNDVAIVSFDDIEIAKHFHLTTMHQPMYEMGALAIQKMMQRMQNIASEPTTESFTPTLIVRESCGANRNYSRFESVTSSR